MSWTGGPFLTSDPNLLGICEAPDPACDIFKLTIVPDDKSFVVDIRIDGANDGDDYDLFVHDPEGHRIGESATASGEEQVTLFDPRAGTYEVRVLAFLVEPGSTYAGSAMLERSGPERPPGGAFHATLVPPEFEGTPANTANKGGTALSVRATYVGRDAIEPTIGVNKNGTAFYAAAAFDSEVPTRPRTIVMRSRDGNRSWQPVSPQLPVGDTTEPPQNFDPYLYVEEDTGRVFSIDLQVACSWLIYSDDEGQSWERNVAACGDPVNDHQTIVAGPPRAGLQVQGFPEVLYYCFNRVSDSSCGRSRDGGDNFELTRDPAFLGVDAEAGGFCGGLHGHLATDHEGRVFLPKGHCRFPWIAISEDNGDSWQRVRISGHVPLPSGQHEVSVAVDAADNLYAVWWDMRDRLPYLATSTDHGLNWSVPLMMAPPGVHEVNFPTIAAGDEGRIAIMFPGTTVDDRADDTRPWNSYHLVSIDALAENPLFTWTTANDPVDPIHRGDCGPGRCDNMFDFLDIQASAADGSFWSAIVDTCTGGCVADPEAPANDGAGVAVRQLHGPSLWAPGHKSPDP